MFKINRKGFTLVEVLAVIVILGVIMLIAIPNVSSLINKNKIDSCNSLKKNIINATKTYFSDYRYEISVNTGICSTQDEAPVLKINGKELVNSNFQIKILIDDGYLKEANDKLINPKTGDSIDSSTTFVQVKYDCKKKDYNYTISTIDCD